MRIARPDETQARIKTVGSNINNLRFADYTTHMAESEELKSLLMKVKEESENDGLKLNIHQINIILSNHFMQIGKRWKQWETFFWGGSPKSLQMVTEAMKLKDPFSLE